VPGPGRNQGPGTVVSALSARTILLSKGGPMSLVLAIVAIVLLLVGAVLASPARATQCAFVAAAFALAAWAVHSGVVSV
jgi:hypothetical protein